MICSQVTRIKKKLVSDFEVFCIGASWHNLSRPLDLLNLDWTNACEESKSAAHD